MDAKPESCATCRFWLGDPAIEDGVTKHDSDRGYCRRFPPMAFHISRGFEDADTPEFDPCNWNHPITRGTSWCGEWSPPPVRE